MSRSGCPVDINYPSLEGAENPYPQYDWMRAEQPVYQVPGTTDFLVTRYADVAEVAKNWEVFSSVGSRSIHNPFNETGSGTATESVIEADPPSHRAKRDLCAHAFKPPQLRARIPMITEVCDGLIDTFVDRGSVDLVAAFAEHVPLLVMAGFLGFDDRDLEWLSGWSRVDNGGLSFLPPQLQERQRRDAQWATGKLVEVILDRRDNPRDDELSGMIRRHVDRDGRFDLDHIRDNTVTLIRGGVITTAHLISRTMLLLLEQPAEMARVRADHALLPRVIEESLRVESPVQWTPRRVTSDTEVGGVAIPAGSRVLIMWGSANRDDDTFPGATTFDPDRPNANAQVAFGLGPHFCLGAPLARLETRIAFERLLSRLRDIRLVPGQELDHSASAQFRGLNRLEIEFERA